MAVEATQREFERSCGGPIEPLHVVQRQEHGRVVRKRRDERHDRGPDRARIQSRPAGVGSQQRDLERTTLRAGQRRERLGFDAGEEVAKAGE
jgi:hypothetical protein